MVCRVVGQLSAVLDCIRDVSRVLNEVDVIVDEGSTVFNITWVSDLSFLSFVTKVRAYEFLTASSPFNDTPGVVDGTREDYEAKCQVLVSTELMIVMHSGVLNNMWYGT